MTTTVERSGEVIGLDNGVAKIRLELASGCSGCGSQATCSSGSARTREVFMELPAGTMVGDQITVSLPSSSVALAAVVGYLLPLLCLLLGAIAADTFYGGNVAAVLGAVSGFVSGLLLARLIAFFALGNSLHHAQCRTDFHPHSSTGDFS